MYQISWQKKTLNETKIFKTSNIMYGRLNTLSNLSLKAYTYVLRNSEFAEFNCESEFH